MTTHQLYQKLVASYTQENLHKITTKIISLYNNKQYAAIEQIMHLIDDQAESSNHSKMFYRLMMVYHPDRLTFYRGEIEKYFKEQDTNKLQQFAHIFSALELEQTLITLQRPPGDAVRDEQYGWETPDSGFGYEDIDNEIFDEFETQDYGTDFYSVLKRNLYGHENVELPFYYLEDLDSLDLSGYGMTDLDGIRYCTMLLILDVSNNEIVDISELATSAALREVFLSSNMIGFIDALGFMKHLRIADLSYNQIDDLSPLFGLSDLEYVNILGNPVPEDHIRILRQRGVVVIH